MRFSDRTGITSASKIMQQGGMDIVLRNSLWSVLTKIYWQNYRSTIKNSFGRSDYINKSNFETLIESLWFSFFKQPIDTIHDFWEPCLAYLRSFFFHSETEWYEIYNFIEFVALNGPPGYKIKFITLCNETLERENSAYRFVGDHIVEITSPQEIDEIENAILNATPYAGVKSHLISAISLMSNKENPDYRNSIKESISSVESLARQITNDNSGTLESILKKLEQSKKLHPALKKAFSALYGYTSDADGIRHALLEESCLTKADARFMLVCCSAFVNYSIEAINT